MTTRRGFFGAMAAAVGALLVSREAKADGLNLDPMKDLNGSVRRFNLDPYEAGNHTWTATKEGPIGTLSYCTRPGCHAHTASAYSFGEYDACPVGPDVGTVIYRPKEETLLKKYLAVEGHAFEGEVRLDERIIGIDVVSFTIVHECCDCLVWPSFNYVVMESNPVAKCRQECLKLIKRSTGDRMIDLFMAADKADRQYSAALTALRKLT